MTVSPSSSQLPTSYGLRSVALNIQLHTGRAKYLQEKLYGLDTSAAHKFFHWKDEARTAYGALTSAERVLGAGVAEAKRSIEQFVDHTRPEYHTAMKILDHQAQLHKQQFDEIFASPAALALRNPTDRGAVSSARDAAWRVVDAVRDAANNARDGVAAQAPELVRGTSDVLWTDSGHSSTYRVSAEFVERFGLAKRS